ncbi:UNVERIFIED_CONTAM: hypothetical protein FKN15_019022 [Acipenser sinensis]
MLSPLYADGSVIVDRASRSWMSSRQKTRRPRQKELHHQHHQHHQHQHNHLRQQHRTPPTTGGSLQAPPSYYHAVFDVRVESSRDSGFSFAGDGPPHPGTRLPPASLYLHMSADGSEAPPVYRRRGGVVEHRDVIKAHEAHKIQSTPQALRKEWE